MVHNPLSEPYPFKWDGFITLIPAVTQDKGYGKGNALLDRGLANKYVKEMTDLFLTKLLDDATNAENGRRIEKGMKEMTEYEEQPVFETKFRINDPEKRKETLDTVWLGVYHEYGMDVPATPEDTMISDNRPIDEQLLDTMNKPYIKDNASTKEHADFNNSEELQGKGVFALRSIAKDMGIDVEKTAKKDDIINRIQQP